MSIPAGRSERMGGRRLFTESRTFRPIQTRQPETPESSLTGLASVRGADPAAPAVSGDRFRAREAHSQPVKEAGSRPLMWTLSIGLPPLFQTWSPGTAETTSTLLPGAGGGNLCFQLHYEPVGIESQQPPTP